MTSTQPSCGKSQPQEFKGRKSSRGGRSTFGGRGRGGSRGYRKVSEVSSKGRTSGGVTKKTSGTKNGAGNMFRAPVRSREGFGAGGGGGGIGMMPT